MNSESADLVDDIEVRFYEEDDEGELIWQAFGSFSAADIHHQVCLFLSNSILLELMFIQISNKHLRSKFRGVIQYKLTPFLNVAVYFMHYAVIL